MITELLEPTEANIEKCAKLLTHGEVVAFPTETVYGLGGNALDGNAALKIFEAKGRPATNPLIIHVSNKLQIESVAIVPDEARKLIDALMPGPLTLVLNKKGNVPDEVTAGFSTVGVRMPDHPIALKLIEMAGVPIAAPSANTSSRPSPTRAEHVFDDLSGKIPAIIDGGKCPLGMESTIINMTCNPPRIIRAGSVTLTQIEEIIGSVDASSIMPLSAENRNAPTHFVPNINFMFSAYFDGMAENIISYYDTMLCRNEKPVVFCMSQSRGKYAGKELMSMGNTVEEYSRNLFEKIREAERNYTVIIAEGVPMSGIGVTLLSRLVKLSKGQVI